MFRLHLHAPPRATDLRWQARTSGGRWISGPDWIEPFTHSALEHHLILGPGGRGFLVNRERRRGAPVTKVTRHTADEQLYARLLGEAEVWPLGFVLIEFDPDGIRITASSWGVAPVHLAVAAGALRGSWDLLDLVDYIDPGKLDPVEIVRFLTYSPVYSSQTLLADVAMVTERATATFTCVPGRAGTLHITYPEPGHHALPRDLRDGADPVAAFEETLAAVIDQWAFSPEATVADLSGGMDSTNVALTLARLYPRRVATGAMLLAGDYGRQQQRRRAKLRRADFAEDHQLEMVEHLPFAPAGPRARGHRFHPEEGPYAEARNQLLDRYAAAGKTVVFTGLGGDEAMKVRPWERPAQTASRLDAPPRPLRVDGDHVPVYLGAPGRRLLAERHNDAAPIGPTVWSILDCFAALYPHYMRRGLWPVNPLAAPQIVRLAESLPTTWRMGKRLLRDRLTRLGFDTDVTHPTLPENFQHILDRAMRRHGATLLESLLDDGAQLVADGFLDETELRAAARCFATTGNRTYEVYRPLMLEAALRSLTRTAPADPAAAPRTAT